MNVLKNENIKTASITPEESMMIERSFYICDSYERFLSVLVREFTNNPSDKTKEMIEHYRILYQNELVALKTKQNAIIASIVGKLYPDMSFEFDFSRYEVTIKW